MTAETVAPVRTSPFLRAVQQSNGTRTFVYHTLFGNPRILNSEGIDFIRLLGHGVNLANLADAVEGDATTIIEEFSQIGFLVPEDAEERRTVSRRRDELLEKVAARQSVDHISISVSDDCNFGCRHCMFYQPDSAGNRLPIYQKPAHDLNMTWATAKACIDAYLAILRERGDTMARIHFGNAEPLVNWSVVEQALDYCMTMHEFAFEFAINTNLSLLTPQIAEKLKMHRVKIATSLDGIGDANDAIRTTRGGKGTFEIILSKMDLLDQIGYPLDGVSITVTSQNFHRVDLEVIDFAISRRMTSLAFDFDLVGFSDISVEERVEKILRLKSHANAHGIYFGGTWYSPFRKIMTTSMLEKPHAFCAAMEGRSLVFNPNGSLKTCGYTTTRIGSLEDREDWFSESGGLAQLITARYPGADQLCHGCMIEGPCGGQCHSTWEAASRGSRELFEQMCIFYRTVTDALIQEYLNATDDPAALENRMRYL